MVDPGHNLDAGTTQARHARDGKGGAVAVSKALVSRDQHRGKGQKAQDDATSAALPRNESTNSACSPFSAQLNSTQAMIPLTTLPATSVRR